MKAFLPVRLETAVLKSLWIIDPKKGTSFELYGAPPAFCRVARNFFQFDDPVFAENSKIGEVTRM